MMITVVVMMMMMQPMKPSDGAVFTATFVHASSDAHGHTECTFGDGMSAMTVSYTHLTLPTI